MRRLALAIALLPALALAAAVPPELIAFNKKWPKSTQELGRWARGSPKTAPLWLGWVGQSDENLARGREFVKWILDHRVANPFEFADQHKDWLVFERLKKYSEEGLDGFVQWCRKHKYSCTELFALDAQALRVARPYALKKANLKDGIGARPSAAPPAAAAAESAEGEKPEGEKPAEEAAPAQ
jgi:hypothetical protein